LLRQGCQMVYFQTEKSQFYRVFQWKMFVILNVYLVDLTAIWYFLWPFGIFSQFWYVVQRKIWQPCADVLL
jgi:hypothetical protein